MSGWRSYLASSAILLGVRIASQGLGALAQLIVIPLLAPSQFGVYVLVFSASVVLSTFYHFGIQSSVNKLAPSRLEDPAAITAILDRHGRLFLAASALSALATLLVLAIVLSLGIWQVAHPVLAAATIILNAAALAAETFVFASVLATGRVLLGALMAGGIRAVIFLAALGALAMATDFDLAAAYIATIVSAAITLLAGYGIYAGELSRFRRLAKTQGIGKREVPGNSVPEILRLSRSVTGAYLAVQLRTNAEPFLFASILGLEPAALAAAARRVTNFVFFTTNAIAALLGPLSARHFFRGEFAALQSNHAMVALGSTLFAAACLFLGLLMGEPVLAWLFGTQYSGVGWLVNIMLAMAALRLFFGFPNSLLQVTGDEKQVTFAAVLNLAVLLASALAVWAFGLSLPVLVALTSFGLVIEYAWLWHKARRLQGIRTDALAGRAGVGRKHGSKDGEKA